jgi:5-methylcytosine-specific restriction endonuclease McrA
LKTTIGRTVAASRYVSRVARGRADIANTALRIFLQELGAAYDEERGLTPYRAKDFSSIKAFFGNQCCYCGVELTAGANQDHLIPMNKADLGLHAWGNIVPACQLCNAKKQSGDWKDFIIERAGTQATERHQRMKEFLAEYPYKPTIDLRAVAEDLYAEVGAISVALIDVKIKRVRKSM